MFKKGIIVLIKFYQFCTGNVPHVCRFYPTCSQYMVEAIEKYGLGRGIWKGLGRILRCHPGHPGGVDLP